MGLDRVLHLGPERAIESRRQPLIDQDRGKRIGPEDVLDFEFSRPFEMLNAQAQVVELETGLVLDHLRQARRKDARFHDVVADQLQAESGPWTCGRARRLPGAGQRLAPGVLRQRCPAGTLRLEVEIGIAVFLHLPRIGRLVGQRRESLADRQRNGSDRALGGCDEAFARLAGELQGRCVRPRNH